MKVPKLATQETQQQKLHQHLFESEFLLYALELDLTLERPNASKQPCDIGYLPGLSQGSLDLPVFHTFPKAAPLSVLQAGQTNQATAFENSSLGLCDQVLLVMALLGASKELSLFPSVRIQANFC